MRNVVARGGDLRRGLLRRRPEVKGVVAEKPGWVRVATCCNGVG